MNIHFDFDHYQVRLIKSSDTSMIADYFMRNRNYLAPWEPKRSNCFFTADGWKQRLLQLVEMQKHNVAFYFVIVDTLEKKIIGTISYSNIINFPVYSTNLGYSLDENYQGNGIMRQAVKQTMDWMFSAQHMHRVMAGYMPRNKKSSNVLKALDFTIEGEAKDYLYINDKWEDHILAAKINPHWVAE